MAQHPLPNTKAWISGFMLLLQDVCRPMNWLYSSLSTQRPAAVIKKQACPLSTQRYSLRWHRTGKGFVWGDNPPPGIFILSFVEGGIFDFPLLCGWSLTRSINVKRVFFLFLTKREVWHAHLICLHWANPCFSHSGTLTTPFKIHFQVVICHCRRYWGEKTKCNGGGEESADRERET